MFGVDLASPVGKAASLVATPGPQRQGLIHRDVTLVAVGEGKGHGSFEGRLLVDPEFVLAEHLVGHGGEAPLPAEHHGMGIEAAGRRLLAPLEEVLDPAELFHPARLVLLEVHHLREELPAREGGGGQFHPG